MEIQQLFKYIQKNSKEIEIQHEYHNPENEEVEYFRFWFNDLVVEIGFDYGNNEYYCYNITNFDDLETYMVDIEPDIIYEKIV